MQNYIFTKKFAKNIAEYIQMYVRIHNLFAYKLLSVLKIYNI